MKENKNGLKELNLPKPLGVFLSYFAGFLIGFTGAVILYIEPSVLLSCKYDGGCQDRDCPITCVLKKRWGGFLTMEETVINDFKGISSEYTFVKRIKNSDKDQHHYNLMINHAQGQTTLTPPSGDMYHFPSRDSIVEKTNHFTNKGPAGETLNLWQVNWVMLLIGYSLVLIWPLQIVNIFMTLRKK